VTERIPTTVQRVTLFEDRAEVVRRARPMLPAGPSWVTIGPVTAFVDDRSVRAAAGGEGVRVVSARVRRVVRSEAQASAAEIARLEEEVRQAARAHADAKRRLARISEAEGRAAHGLSEWVRALVHVPRHAAEVGRLDDWRSAWSELDGAVARAHAEAAEVRRERLRAEDEEQRARIRLDQARIESPRVEASIEVQVEAAAEGAAEIDVTYRTPCAVWRPEHVARLRTAEGAPRLELATWAVAWQNTGEAWDDVEVRFSTARTARAAIPPTIAEDVLALRKKSDAEKRRVVVEARDEDVSSVGLDRGTRAVNEMPGVDDGGEPRSYAPAARVSIASDGRPFRVEVARTTLSVEVARVAIPERASVAHVRATATLTSREPLLAGPVRLARDAAIVGRGKLDWVGAGEPFELGFGVDDGIRVRRTQEQVRDTTAIMGTQKVRRTVKVFLSCLGGERRSVEVVERVPVSEIDDVEIVVDSSGWSVDARHGLARQTVQLAARETKVLTLAYEIRASSKVAMTF